MYNCGDSYSISHISLNYVSDKTLASYLENVFVDGPPLAAGVFAIKTELNLASGSAFYADNNVNLAVPLIWINDSAGCRIGTLSLVIHDNSALASRQVVESVLTYTGTLPVAFLFVCHSAFRSIHSFES